MDAVPPANKFSYIIFRCRRLIFHFIFTLTLQKPEGFRDKAPRVKL